ncbi:hypothetical protein DORFOR_03134 [Dorea formicigenerans ATCC 27755]|uniref:Uncharacterized protein n=1 Tax=Dorea formicigenerans ATCC 27755 TaxID=411461 RepID=B0GA18_9FIRM|nr:hypothetical protein DORFOR_03134 [Dorea formicigenerans ATCC 27755]
MSYLNPDIECHISTCYFLIFSFYIMMLDFRNIISFSELD